MFDSGAMNFAPDSGLLSRYFGGGGEWESCSVVQNSPVADELLIGEISSFFALRRLTLTPPAGSIFSKLGTLRGGDFFLGKLPCWTRRATGP